MEPANATGSIRAGSSAARLQLPADRREWVPRSARIPGGRPAIDMGGVTDRIAAGQTGEED
jgi:hypothetical protein